MSIFFFSWKDFLLCKYGYFKYLSEVKQALKYILKIFAKALAIFFTVATLALIIIAFFRPEWIKNGVAWI
jgi:hypothetical protein